MTLRRVILAGSVVLAGLLTTVAPAGAGGSTWDFDAPTYAPGDSAQAVAIVAWAHNPDLGRPEDGPYGAWLLAQEAEPQPGSAVPADAVYVGDLQIWLQPYEVGGVRYGPYHAIVDFTVPDLPPGEYELLHCNQPCTTTLGDITWGVMTVSGGASTTTTTTTTTTSTSAPPPTTVPPTTAAPSTTSVAAASLVADGSGGGGPPSMAFLGMAAMALAFAALVWRLRTLPRPGRPQATVKPT